MNKGVVVSYNYFSNYDIGIVEAKEYEQIKAYWTKELITQYCDKRNVTLIAPSCLGMWI